MWFARRTDFLGSGGGQGQRCRSPGLTGPGRLGGGGGLMRCDLVAGLFQGLKPPLSTSGDPPNCWVIPRLEREGLCQGDPWVPF